MDPAHSTLPRTRRHRRSRRSRHLTGALAVGLVAVIGLGPGSAGADPNDPGSERISGATRYGTSAAVALRICSEFGGPMNIIIASGQGFADALSAAGLAGDLGNGAILLTRPDSLPAEAVTALNVIEEDCGIASTTIVGGLAAVSANVEAQLQGRGVVTRVAGANRYETAVAVARQITAPVDTVILATGTSFPDALSAGNLSYVGPIPLLLNQGPTVLDSVAGYLDEVSVSEVIIMGGTSAIPQSVEDQLRERNYQVVRVAGADRYATAAALWRYVFSIEAPGGLPPGFTFEIIIANGTDFPDALSAAPLGGQVPALMLLVRPDTLPLPAPTLSFLVDFSDYIDNVIAVGGKSAISDRVLGDAVYAATPEPPPDF